jgi:hypothetical protein
MPVSPEGAGRHARQNDGGVVPLYKLVIEGRGVETLVDDSLAVLGFVATRWLRASGPDVAER